MGGYMAIVFSVSFFLSFSLSLSLCVCVCVRVCVKTFSKSRGWHYRYTSMWLYYLSLMCFGKTFVQYNTARVLRSINRVVRHESHIPYLISSTHPTSLPSVISDPLLQQDQSSPQPPNKSRDPSHQIPAPPSYFCSLLKP